MSAGKLTAEDEQSFQQLLYADANQDASQPPLLAHYTSLDVLEKILRDGELWFSNPLFMNDLEELRYGLTAGARIFSTNQAIRMALTSPQRHDLFLKNIDSYLRYFEQKHLLDTYVLCLSVHSADRNDGRLSMWRGYGGNGRGAALVIDGAKIEMLEGSPFVVARVHYGTQKQREDWIEARAEQAAQFIARTNCCDEDLWKICHAIMERLKLFALFTKHTAFDEEQEWRIVYLKERDKHDMLQSMRSYHIGGRGIEPKLKFKVAPLSGVVQSNMALETIVSKILIGPSTGAPLVLESSRRMVGLLRPALEDRVRLSTIPYRPSGH